MTWPIWGNYCGAGWTGGKLVGPSEGGDFEPDPTDPLDAQCKIHDAAYGQASIASRAGDTASYWAQILAADRALVTGLKLLLDSMDQNWDGSKYEMYSPARFQ